MDQHGLTPGELEVVQEGPERFPATWSDEQGKEQSAVLDSEREAVAEVA